MTIVESRDLFDINSCEVNEKDVPIAHTIGMIK